MINVPPQAVNNASVTVTISEVTGEARVTAVDQDSGVKCENMLVASADFFTPCAHPLYLEGPVKRFNLIINAAAGGKKNHGGDRPDDPGDGTGK